MLLQEILDPVIRHRFDHVPVQAGCCFGHAEAVDDRFFGCLTRCSEEGIEPEVGNELNGIGWRLVRWEAVAGRKSDDEIATAMTGEGADPGESEAAALRDA